jgi:hypothetical protein
MRMKSSVQTGRREFRSRGRRQAMGTCDATRSEAVCPPIGLPSDADFAHAARRLTHIASSSVAGTADRIGNAPITSSLKTLMQPRHLAPEWTFCLKIEGGQSVTSEKAPQTHADVLLPFSRAQGSSLAIGAARGLSERVTALGDMNEHS